MTSGGPHCPRRSRMTYVERPVTARGQAWAHTTVGAAVHVALARWWSAPRDRRTPAAARTSLELAWPRCAWCDHLRACPAGQAAAGPPRRPWDGLPDEAA